MCNISFITLTQASELHASPLHAISLNVRSRFKQARNKISHMKYSHFSVITSQPWLKRSFFSSPAPPALHMASIGQHAEAATALLQLGLEDSEDALGATARQHAKKPDVVRVFQPDERDARVHCTVLHWNMRREQVWCWSRTHVELTWLHTLKLSLRKDPVTLDKILLKILSYKYVNSYYWWKFSSSLGRKTIDRMHFWRFPPPPFFYSPCTLKNKHTKWTSGIAFILIFFVAVL